MRGSQISQEDVRRDSPSATSGGIAVTRCGVGGSWGRSMAWKLFCLPGKSQTAAFFAPFLRPRLHPEAAVKTWLEYTFTKSPL